MPCTVQVSGQLANCTPGAMVTVQTLPGTMPQQTVSIPVDGNCGFHASMGLTTATGGVFAYASCANGTMAGDSTTYAASAAGDTVHVELDLACTGAATGNCQACLSVAQTAPFTVQFTSCSSGGTAPYTNIWLLPDGMVALGDNATFTFGGPGAFGICLQTSDATGCSSVACDTIFVGADGTINPPTMPPCLAGFWTLQAYSNAGGGMIAPIPNEVWAWNLSSGSTQPMEYAWDFGDGAISSEAYPSHDYDGNGPYILCLTITSGNCSDSHCDTISINADGLLNGLVLHGHGEPAENTRQRSSGFTLNVIPALLTGISDVPGEVAMRLWPNPAEDQLNLSVRSMAGGTVPFTVIDATGRLVLHEEHGLVPGANTLQLATGPLGPGLYMVRIGNALPTFRFLKVR